MAEANFANRTLFHGDNLPFLRGMNSETVDLVATDPPFNKSRDFHATPDSLAAGAKFEDRWRWDEDVHDEWVDQIKDDWPKAWAVIEAARQSWGDGMGAYLCWLGVRLMECHRVLKPTGSLYLHCDDTASHYLKALMDAIFGASCFRSHLVWRRATSHNSASNYGRILDHILYYGKTKAVAWNGRDLYTPKTEAELKVAYPTNDTPGPVRSENLTGPGVRYGESGKPWHGFDVTARGRHWAPPRDGHYAKYIEQHFIPAYRSIQGTHARLDALDAAGLIQHPTKGKWPGLKRYAAADQGNPPTNLILDPIGFTNYNKGIEFVGYPTQKPLDLYKRIIQASSNRGDLVLDPFCGCATTPIAAEHLRRQWVGIDIWDRAHQTVLDRLADEGLAAAEGSRAASGLIRFGEVHYDTTPPERTDDNEVAAPILRLKLQRALAPWQLLSHRAMVEHLVEAQATQRGMGLGVSGRLVICAGCGRTLEREFMQLDHIQPRADGGANDITNRILLCYPCNGRKGADYTLRGLVNRNKRDGWMQSEDRAKVAQVEARHKAEQVREG